jgi:glycosyltransferase involved in cell wall biosynthesis
LSSQSERLRDEYGFDMSASTVCAIVPTYNRASLLRECLDSLLTQTRPLDEIIVVNDGSTDSTEDVLRAYVGKAHILRQDNAGKAAALNNALAHCYTAYVWICDDDDIAEPDACATLASALDADPAAGFSYGRYRRFQDVSGVREIFPMSYWPLGHQKAFFLELLERCFVFQFCTMIRRSAYREIGPFDTRLLRSQDYDMMVRIARRYKGVYVNKSLFLQRWHSGPRGVAADRFSATSSTEKWLTYDRIIFDRVRREVPLDELTPLFARSLSANEMQRGALLQRACICGRHAMWHGTITDLEQACALSPSVPASPEEQAIVERTLAEMECVPSLIEDRTLRQRLQALFRNSTFGRSISGPLARPLFWQIRLCAKDRQLAALLSRVRILIALLGVPRAIGRGCSLALLRLAPGRR